MPLSLTELLSTLPPEWPTSLLPDIRRQVQAGGRKVVVLDDDPTGTQTVAGVPVLTRWTPEALAAEMREPGTLFYILTNSRAYPLARAQALNREIAAALRSASAASGRDFVVVSRSDSTLRGHYPGEVEALAEGLGGGFDGVLIVPFFLEGGRYTVEDVHYVASGGMALPAAETEYARDPVFGYAHSNLREWVSEKTGGRIAARDVESITLKTLRSGGPAAVREGLLGLRGMRPCAVNAASYRDLEVLVAGLLEAEAAGRRYLYRTAASFVRVRAGMDAPSPLTAADLTLHMRGAGGRGGLIIVGSHIRRTTEQIRALEAAGGVESVELDVPELLRDSTREARVAAAAEATDRAIAAGQDALVYTSRAPVAGGGEAGALEVGRRVSAALVEVVRRLQATPAWIIAKGGITSSDVATEALGILRATVLGQAIPGVPVWLAGGESRWPGIVYVVFPGNVGGPGALAEMAGILRHAPAG